MISLSARLAQGWGFESLRVDQLQELLWIGNTSNITVKLNIRTAAGDYMAASDSVVVRR